MLISDIVKSVIFKYVLVIVSEKKYIENRPHFLLCGGFGDTKLYLQLQIKNLVMVNSIIKILFQKFREDLRCNREKLLGESSYEVKVVMVIIHLLRQFLTLTQCGFSPMVGCQHLPQVQRSEEITFFLRSSVATYNSTIWKCDFTYYCYHCVIIGRCVKFSNN